MMSKKSWKPCIYKGKPNFIYTPEHLKEDILLNSELRVLNPFYYKIMIGDWKKNNKKWTKYKYNKELRKYKRWGDFVEYCQSRSDSFLRKYRDMKTLIQIIHSGFFNTTKKHEEQANIQLKEKVDAFDNKLQVKISRAYYERCRKRGCRIERCNGFTAIYSPDERNKNDE